MRGVISRPLIMPVGGGSVFGALLVLAAVAAVAGGFVIVNADQDADGSNFPYKGALDRVVITVTESPRAHSAPEEIID